MKPVLKLSAIAASLFLVIGCQGETAAETTPAKPVVEQVEVVEQPAPVQVAEQSIDLTNEDSKAAYAIGASLGQYLATNLERQEELGLNMNSEDVLLGVHDAFNGESKMTGEEMQQALQALDTRVQTLALERQTQQAEERKSQGEAFRTAFASEDGTVVTDTGLMYQVVEMGEGVKPGAQDTVEVHYVGTLIDGTEFDSSYSRQQPISFPLDQVISGWTEGLQLMPVGSKFKFVIPPELAYGEQNTPAIPANSTLVFEVELLSIPVQAVAEVTTEE